MRIVALEELGEVGGSEGTPAVFNWRWYYQVPSLALCVLTLAMLVSLRSKGNWLVIPLTLTIALWMLEGLSLLFGVLAAAWIVVWLAGRWPAVRQPVALRPRSE